MASRSRPRPVAAGNRGAEEGCAPLGTRGGDGATITITLSEAAARQLRKMADRAGALPEEFLRLTVENGLAHETEEDYEVIPPPTAAEFDRPEDFLTPEQRLDAIAEILATIALRVVREEQSQQAPAEPEQKKGSKKKEQESHGPTEGRPPA